MFYEACTCIIRKMSKTYRNRVKRNFCGSKFRPICLNQLSPFISPVEFISTISHYTSRLVLPLLHIPSCSLVLLNIPNVSIFIYLPHQLLFHYCSTTKRLSLHLILICTWCHACHLACRLESFNHLTKHHHTSHVKHTIATHISHHDSDLC